MIDPALAVAVGLLPLAAAVVDDDGRVEVATDALGRVLRAEVEDLRGGVVEGWFPTEAGVVQRLRAAADGRGGLRLEGRRTTGVPFTADVHVARHGEGMLCVLTEVTESQLGRDPHGYLAAAFDRAPIGMALFNTDGEYVRVNRVLCEMLGRDPGWLLGRRDQELTHPDDREADVQAAWRVLRGEMSVWQTEKRFVAADGRVVWAIANLTFIRDPEGRPLCWLGQFQDITHRKGREVELAHLAEHDELTGLANRRGLMRALAQTLGAAGRHQDRGAVLLLDLDGFKGVNDRRGHAAGDALLVAVAGALRARVRDNDTVARLGGDEFAVVLPQASPQGAEAAAAALAASVGEASGGTVTASFGIAHYGPDRAATVQGLLAEADALMYHAKHDRRRGAAPPPPAVPVGTPEALAAA